MLKVSGADAKLQPWPGLPATALVSGGGDPKPPWSDTMVSGWQLQHLPSLGTGPCLLETFCWTPGPHPGLLGKAGGLPCPSGSLPVPIPQQPVPYSLHLYGSF